MWRPAWFICAVLCASLYAGVNAHDTLVKEFDENSWRQLLEGEWMVEFYAPWCPACNAMKSAWRELSLRADSQLGVKTAAIDVTKSAGLSGRFFVTALPTIYHVKNREFRQYKGPRDVDSMVAWLKDGRWREVEPVSAWKNPDSMQMSVLSWFFKLSQALRGVHTMLMETYGLPVWGSYLIFAVATILIGALLGLLMVCCVDAVMPVRQQRVVIDKRDEIETEDLVDDADEAQSEEEAEEENRETQGDGQEIRKRRPRKE